MSNIIGAEQLHSITGINQDRALERYLEQSNIRYFPSKNGPWTTIGLIEAAGGLVPITAANSDSADEIL